MRADEMLFVFMGREWRVVMCLAGVGLVAIGYHVAALAVWLRQRGRK